MTPSVKSEKITEPDRYMYNYEESSLHQENKFDFLNSEPMNEVQELQSDQKLCEDSIMSDSELVEIGNIESDQ